MHVLLCVLYTNVLTVFMSSQTLFTILFFTSFHEFVRIVKEKLRSRAQDGSLDTDGELPLIDMHKGTYMLPNM